MRLGGSMSRILIGWARLVPVVVITLALASVAASPALADGLYVGQSPSVTQCDNQKWSIIADNSMMLHGQSVGSAYLRYSPACGTDWVTVYFDSSKYFMMP